jgi:putative lipoprotein
MDTVRTVLKTVIACCAALVLGGCAGPERQPMPEGALAMSKVTGTVAYRSRIALPPTAVVTVRLVDVSRADAPAVVIGQQVIETAGGQVPIPFEIVYDPAQIDPRTRLAVQARIENAGTLLFITDRRYSVAGDGAPARVELELVSVPGKRP